MFRHEHQAFWKCHVCVFFNEVRLKQKHSMLAQWGCLFVLPTACWGKVQLKFKYVDIAWSCVPNRFNVAEIVHRVPTQVAPGENHIPHVIPVSKKPDKNLKVSASSVCRNFVGFSHKFLEKLVRNLSFSCKCREKLGSFSKVSRETCEKVWFLHSASANRANRLIKQQSVPLRFRSTQNKSP